jgi:phytoene synthase
MSPSKSFREIALPSLFLEPQQKQGAWSLYNWFQQIDESVHSDPQPLQERVRAVQAETVRALHDWTESEGPYRSLGWAAEHFSIQEDHALDLIQGLRLEAQGGPFADEDTLLRYCYSRAGTLGLMMCAVMNIRDRKVHSYAVALAQAIQLTKIAQNLSGDLAEGRCYIPQTWLESEGLSLQEFCDFPFRRIPLIERTLNKAEELFAKGIEGLPALPWRAAFTAASAALMSRAISQKIRSRPKAYLQRQAVLLGVEKWYWMTRAAWLTLLSRQFWV